MVKNRQKTLGRFELEIMHVIWDKGKSTVQEVKDSLSELHPAAYTTFMTMLRRLESKDFLKHEMHEDGKTYVYKPLISREDVTVSMFQDIYDRLLLGSSERLLDVLNTLFRKEKMTSDDIQRLRKLIAEKEEQDE